LFCSRPRGKTFSAADKDYGDLGEFGCAELDISPEELEAKRSTALNSLKLSSQEKCQLERNTIDQVLIINYTIIIIIKKSM